MADRMSNFVTTDPPPLLPVVLNEATEPDSRIREALHDVRSALRSPAAGVDAKNCGAVGDGVADDTEALQAAIAQADALDPRVAPIYLPSGTYLHTALTNPMGHEFIGPGRLVRAITGGRQQTNSYADAHKYVFGREYMSHFHKQVMGSVLAQKIIMSGDSTTFGVGASSPFLMHELVMAMAMDAGLPETVALNRGHSSKTTVDWLATYLAADLAENPDVLVLRWGINDSSYRVTLGDRAALDQFVANTRTGLAAIRAAKGAADLSIILCSPNSTSDTPNKRDEEWYEQIVPALKQAARDYQAVFVDVYGYLRDTRNAGDWMELTYAPDRYVHPLNVMNMWIASLIGDVLFPRALGQAANNRFVNATNGTTYFADLLASRVPTFYPQGITVARAMAANGWPVDGAVMTVRQPDGVWMQINFPYDGETLGGIAMRVGTTGGAGWSAWWRSVGKTRVAPTFGASVAIDASLGEYFDVLASTGSAYAIANPTPTPNNQQIGQQITIRIRNNSGGALGAATWGAQYRLAAWTNPADGYGRAITFMWDGNNWWEIGRTTADVPN